MLHLAVYHQSFAVAGNRKAPAGKLQFKNERIAMNPRLPATSQLSPFHISLMWFLHNTAGFMFWFAFNFLLPFFSIFSSPIYFFST